MEHVRRVTAFMFAVRALAPLPRARQAGSSRCRL